MCLQKNVRREERKGITKEKTAKEQNEREDDKRNLLYEHKEPVQTIGIHSRKIGSLNNCTDN